MVTPKIEIILIINDLTILQSLILVFDYLVVIDS